MRKLDEYDNGHASDFGDLMRGEKNLNPPEPEILHGGSDPTGGNRGSGDPTLGEEGNRTTPREGLPGSNGNISSAPQMSSSPRPAQRAVSGGAPGSIGAPSGGVVVSPPLPGGGPVGMRGMAGSRLFGALGGLQGGGIGVPGATGYNETGQQDISQLMQMLKRKGGLF